MGEGADGVRAKNRGTLWTHLPGSVLQQVLSLASALANRGSGFFGDGVASGRTPWPTASPPFTELNKTGSHSLSAALVRRASSVLPVLHGVCIATAIRRALRLPASIRLSSTALRRRRPANRRASWPRRHSIVLGSLVLGFVAWAECAGFCSQEPSACRAVDAANKRPCAHAWGRLGGDSV